MSIGRRSFLATAAAGAGAAIVAACGGGRRSSTSSTTTPVRAAGQQTTAPRQGARGSSSSASTGTGREASPSATTVPSHTGPATFVAHGPTTSSGVALTFHTAGPVAITDDILAQAAALGARLTFFVVGQWVTANPGMARKIVAGGHELGNHTWSHIDLPKLGPDAMRAEVQRCADVLVAQTGSASRWFRPSQTDVPSPAILTSAGAVGYATSVGYDVDPLDYNNPGAATVLARTRSRLHPGAIVSLHTLYPGTARAFADIVAAVRAKGLEAVTVSSVLGP